jgi:transcriptional regulator with XRE-family HTH domain
MLLNLTQIKEKRTKLNISLQDMADDLGFKNASTYMKYEKGIYLFKANHLPIIASKLKCSIESLFFD